MVWSCHSSGKKQRSYTMRACQAQSVWSLGKSIQNFFPHFSYTRFILFFNIWPIIQSLIAKKRCLTLWPKLGSTQSLLSFFTKSSRQSSSAKSSETTDVCSIHTIANAHITQHRTCLFSILYRVKTWIRIKKLICFQFISIFQCCHGPGPCKVLKEGSFFIWPVQLTALFL